MKPMEHDAIVELVKGLEKAYARGESDAFSGLAPLVAHGLSQGHRDCYAMGYRAGVAQSEQSRGVPHPYGAPT